MPRNARGPLRSSCCPTQAQQVEQVIEPVPRAKFARTALPRAHLVADFAQPLKTAAHENFHQRLEPHGPQFDAGNGFAAENVAAAERVRSTAKGLRQDDSAELVCNVGIDAPVHGPVADASAFREAAGY